MSTINNFQYFSGDNIFLNIKIGYKVPDIFEENDEALVKQYYKNQDKGIKWNNDSKGESDGRQQGVKGLI